MKSKPFKDPLYVLSLLSDIGTPVSVFNRLAQDEPTAFLFESTEGDSRLARYSIIGVDPIVTVSFAKGIATREDRLEGKVQSHSFVNPLHFLQSVLQENASFKNGNIGTVPFSGGLVGYLGYAATRYFENIPQQEQDVSSVPEGFYGLYDSAVVFDHQYRTIKIISHRGQSHAQWMLERLMRPLPLASIMGLESNLSDEHIFEGVSSSVSREYFIDLVNRAKQFIVEGQVFQIVVSQRFSFPVASEPLTIYRILQALNPSPYAYLLKCPTFSYLGSSPETFVKCQGGQVVLRALAGTRPRGANVEEDEHLSLDLRSDEKELAEHRMLVDLGRNDLGRVCKVGSIKVGDIATLTKYTHVMHLATELTGELLESKGCFDLFQSCFPRGTVSGAPKVRAMQLLSQLEPEQRGIYSGVVGYFDFSGDMDGAIAIRSALVKNGIAHVNAGAGVVFDSKPESEYEETRNKARSVLKAIRLAERMN